jgi:hypothetical protein
MHFHSALASGSLSLSALTRSIAAIRLHLAAAVMASSTNIIPRGGNGATEELVPSQAVTISFEYGNELGNGYMSDLDEPATMIWFSTPDPDANLGRPCNSAPFDTLREAVLFVVRMSVDERESAMIRTHGGKELASQDIEAMDKTSPDFQI